MHLKTPTYMICLCNLKCMQRLFFQYDWELWTCGKDSYFWNPASISISCYSLTMLNHCLEFATVLSACHNMSITLLWYTFSTSEHYNPSWWGILRQANWNYKFSFYQSRSISPFSIHPPLLISVVNKMFQFGSMGLYNQNFVLQRMLAHRIVFLTVCMHVF